MINCRSTRGAKWRLRAPFVLLAATLVFFVAAAQASALKYFSKTKTVPSTLPIQNGRGEATATCPNSHPHVIGGGVRISGDDSHFDLEVASTNPSGTGNRAWLGEANNSSGSKAQM